MHIGVRHLGLSLSVTLLAACGGGGGGGNTVALKSESDVTREVANVYALYGGGSVASRSVSAKAQARAAAMRAQVAKGAPKAETVGCDSGSYTYDTFTNVSRTMPLFNAAPAVDYSYYDFNNCYNIEGLNAYTDDGYEEYGHNGPYTATSPENPSYGYHVWGSGSSWLVSKIEPAPGFSHTGRSTERARGRFEFRDNGSTAETREIVDFTLSVRDEQFSEDITLGAGETGNPLIVADNYAAGNATIDGPFFYGTSGDCRGGRIDYDTVEPLVFAEDGNGTYVSAGELAMSSGSTTVTLSFQPDGDISYELSSGETGEITRAELASTNACGVFINE